MKKIRLNIGGEKGNAFYIMGTVEKLCRSEGRDDPKATAKDICAKMRGDTFKNLGGSGNDYEGLLRTFINEFPYVELYSTYDLGLPEDLCTIDEDPEIYEL